MVLGPVGGQGSDENLEERGAAYGGAGSQFKWGVVG